MAQVDLGVGSIGGKDSMSGSFEDLDVPPTLVSFATACGHVDNAMSPEFKGVGHEVLCIHPFYEADGLMPEKAGLLECLDTVERLIKDGQVLAVGTPGFGCDAELIFKMCLGNGIGLRINDEVDLDTLFVNAYGSFLVELAPGVAPVESTENMHVVDLGETIEEYAIIAGGQTVRLAVLQEAWESELEDVFPYREDGGGVDMISDASHVPLTYCGNLAKPRVIIPVFPGNNCEYDTALAFERAGALPETFIINNLTPDAVAESTRAFVEKIDNSQIIMIPGGFSGGDEPDGSAKFITAFFRNPNVTEAVRRLLNDRDGLMLGICNGFQALVKLGLVPYGDIVTTDAGCPTLTFNTIGRHQSRIVRTRVASNLSPWLSRCEVGDIHTVAISHGEGRFVANDDTLEQLIESGQIATQYVGLDGMPSMDLDVNPNGSVLAIEGITSPDGRVLGKMGHTERWSAGVYQNIPDLSYQPLIEGGVGYFTE